MNVAPPAAPVAVKPALDPAPVYHLDHAQVNLPRVHLLVGAKDVNAELCYTLSQVATGQMHRESIGPDDGMLFIFGGASQRSFYMKNVKFPIAAAYIDAEGIIQEIVQLKAFDVTPVPSKSQSIQFVLETAPDWFERNHIAVGTQMVTEKGPLAATMARLAQLQ